MTQEVENDGRSNTPKSGRGSTPHLHVQQRGNERGRALLTNDKPLLGLPKPYQDNKAKANPNQPAENNAPKTGSTKENIPTNNDEENQPTTTKLSSQRTEIVAKDGKTYVVSKAQLSDKKNTELVTFDKNGKRTETTVNKAEFTHDKNDLVKVTNNANGKKYRAHKSELENNKKDVLTTYNKDGKQTAIKLKRTAITHEQDNNSKPQDNLQKHIEFARKYAMTSAISKQGVNKQKARDALHDLVGDITENEFTGLKLRIPLDKIETNFLAQKAGDVSTKDYPSTQEQYYEALAKIDHLWKKAIPVTDNVFIARFIIGDSVGYSTLGATKYYALISVQQDHDYKKMVVAQSLSLHSEETLFTSVTKLTQQEPQQKKNTKVESADKQTAENALEQQTAIKVKKDDLTTDTKTNDNYEANQKITADELEQELMQFGWRKTKPNTKLKSTFITYPANNDNLFIRLNSYFTNGSLVQFNVSGRDLNNKKLDYIKIPDLNDEAYRNANTIENKAKLINQHLNNWLATQPNLALSNNAQDNQQAEIKDTNLNNNNQQQHKTTDLIEKTVDQSLSKNKQTKPNTNKEPAPAPTNITTANFAITDDLANDIANFTKTQRVNANIRAIELLQQIEKQNRRATSSEQQLLAQYTSFGGLADSFKNNKTNTKLQELLNADEYKAIKRSSLDAYFTPHNIIKEIWQALQDRGLKNGLLLESSMGIGNFIGAMPSTINATIMGIEQDSISARIATLLYPNASINRASFEKYTLLNNTFDLAIGNPPYGDFKLHFKDKPHLNKFNVLDQFLLAQAEYLAPNGILTAVVSHNFLDKKDNSARKLLHEQAELLGAIRLPSNVFDSTGAKVISDIVFFRKRGIDNNKRIYDERKDWVNTSEYQDGIHVNNYFYDKLIDQVSANVIGKLTTRHTQYGLQLDVVEDLPDLIRERLRFELPYVGIKSTADTEAKIKRTHEILSTLQEANLLQAQDKIPGYVELDNDGRLIQTIKQPFDYVLDEKITSGDDSGIREKPNIVLTQRELTPSTPWSSNLDINTDDKYYLLSDTTNFKKGHIFKNEADIPANLLLGDTGFKKLTALIEITAASSVLFLGLKLGLLSSDCVNLS